MAAGSRHARKQSEALKGYHQHGLLASTTAACLGFDIAKDTITVCDGNATRTIANQRRVIRTLLKSYKRIDLVVCEPTGGHEGLLLEECLRAGIACHRADTLKVKSFIRSYGTHGKSDAIDAGLLWTYGRER